MNRNLITLELNSIHKSSTAKISLVALIYIFSNKLIHGTRLSLRLETRCTHHARDHFMHLSPLRTTSTFLVGMMVRTDVMISTASISRQIRGVSWHRMGTLSRPHQGIGTPQLYIIVASTFLADTMATIGWTIFTGTAFKMALGILWSH